MATAVGTPCSPPSPLDTSSSATMSPVYPDRPIRPLPKRSLRARLSPEVADQIHLPAAPSSQGSVFNKYKSAMAQRNGATITNAIKEVDIALPNSARDLETEDNDGYRFRGNTVDSEDEDNIGIVRRLEEYQLQQGISPLSSRSGVNGNSRNSEGITHSVASSNDSIDGYDSFENTNNKKKRKIPTSGSIGPHHVSLSASLSTDLANMGISNSRDVGFSSDGSAEGAGPYYGTGNSAVPVVSTGTGISGAGRGRYGRSARRDTSGRSPLAVSNGNTSNSWQLGRFSGPRRDHASSGVVGKVSKAPTDHGIISAAMAEAAVFPTSPPKGKEHVSLLDQQSSKKATPVNSQFTFTCESDSSKSMVWPKDNSSIHIGAYQQSSEATHGPSAQVPPNSKGFSTQGTQTSPTMAGQNGQNSSSQHSMQQYQQPTTKPRRSAAKRYAVAERQRKLQQQYNNYHHPPREEDIWICEFCEYESIFGVPPVALVRQYEIKDSRERKRLAEKRRLLEKAKMKGRKGKKNGKNSGKTNSVVTSQQPSSSSRNHAQHQGEPLANSQGTQSDEYYAEDFDDDPSEPPPSQSSQQALSSRTTHSAIPPNPQTSRAAYLNGIS